MVLYQNRINVWANIKLYESVLKSIEGRGCSLVCVSVDRHNTEEVSAGESLAGTNDFQ